MDGEYQTIIIDLSHAMKQQQLTSDIEWIFKENLYEKKDTKNIDSDSDYKETTQHNI